MRHLILFIFIFTVIVLGFSTCKKHPRQPNIIIFLADDMGYGDPQCYMPDSKIPTPNIDNIAKEKTEDPFFLYFASTAPHTPIVPAKKFHGKSNAGPYGDLVHQTDYSLGEIIKALERNDFIENTIIIFTSDNGSPARAGDLFVHGDDYHQTGSVIKKYNHNPNSPWRGMKADIFEGGHRVPFIISWPKRIQKNIQINESICAIDIMASLASILNYNLPNNAAEDSYDISDLILGEEVGIDVGKEPLHEAIVHHSVDGSFAIKKGKWKMTPQPGSGGWASAPRGKDKVNTPGQLYDLDADPAETTNLWNSYQKVVEELKAILEKYKSKGRSVSSSK